MHNPLCTPRFLPNMERTSAQQTIVPRLQQVAAEAQQVWGQSMEREKLFRLLR